MSGRSKIVPPRSQNVRGYDLRTVPDFRSTPITAETYERLLAALERVYHGKWRRAVDVCPVAVTKTIDNEADALATIAKIDRTKVPA